jgi:hypothetical protein
MVREIAQFLLAVGIKIATLVTAKSALANNVHVETVGSMGRDKFKDFFAEFLLNNIFLNPPALFGSHFYSVCRFAQLVLL